jgi:hypothetical protein
LLFCDGGWTLQTTSNKQQTTQHHKRARRLPAGKPYPEGMTVDGKGQVSAVYDTATGAYKVAPMELAPFCTGQSHLPDGTVLATGALFSSVILCFFCLLFCGSCPIELLAQTPCAPNTSNKHQKTTKPTKGGDADVGGYLQNGLRAIRLFRKDADAWEVAPVQLTDPHWYPTQFLVRDLFLGGGARVLGVCFGGVTCGVC